MRRGSLHPLLRRRAENVSNVYKETAEGLSLEGPSAAVCRQTRKSGEMGRKIATKETQEGCLSFSINRFPELFRFLYKGIIINHNKKPSQPTLKRRFFKKKAAFFHGPVWERSGADFILKRKGEFF